MECHSDMRYDHIKTMDFKKLSLEVETFPKTGEDEDLGNHGLPEWWKLCGKGS